MGLFNSFNVKSTEKKIREKLSDAFDDSVREVANEATSMNSMLGGLLVQAAIGNLYQSLKDNPELENMCRLYGLDYQSILEDECNKALKRFLE